MNKETDDVVVRAERVEPNVFAAPRRYDLATMFTVTLAYAILFALMSLVGSTVIVSAYVAGFVTLVAVGQAVLFSGEYPRIASLACGSGAFLVIGLGVLIWRGQPALSNTHYFGPLASFVAPGGGLGYVAGVLVGGVFLVSEAVRKRMTRQRNT